MSEKASKGRFLGPYKLQNHSNEGKGKEKKRKRGEGKEEKRERKKSNGFTLSFTLRPLKALKEGVINTANKKGGTDGQT